MFGRFTVLAISLGMSFHCPAQTTPNAARGINPAAGREIFREYCSVCHGVNGRGNGPAAEALRTAPSDLTKLSARNGGRFPASEVVSAIHNTRVIPAHGTPDMPMWGDVFRNVRIDRKKVVDELVRNLTAYIESLQTPAPAAQR